MSDRVPVRPPKDAVKDHEDDLLATLDYDELTDETIGRNDGGPSFRRFK